jgi:hypothetical protein|tara:strand:- start:131 stop:334 length:204 start_codon:yes stop_codon:yes gene_type:complete
MFRLKIIKALQDRYDAVISECEATIEIYLTKPVGIGEHPQHIDEIDKLVNKIAEAEDKIAVLERLKV